jgi:inorganic pyrophosphatase
VLLFLSSPLPQKTLVQGVSDNDPMDVIVISDMLPRGQVIDVIPIALLRLADYGHGREEVDDKVVAVPADKALQSISAQNFFEFSNRCNDDFNFSTLIIKYF